jgi:hypothetical protein
MSRQFQSRTIVLSTLPPEEHDLLGVTEPYFFARSPQYKFKKSKNGRPLVERPFLREKRLSNAQGRGPCEANAGHAPWGLVC